MPTRFHGGVDIADCTDGEVVRPIRAGTTTATTSCNQSSCRRIVDENGHAFDYVHLRNINVGIGVFVTTSTSLAEIDGTHLHLNEIQPILGINQRINPQRAGALDFNKANNNNPILVSTNVGKVQDQGIFLVPEFGAPVTGPVEPFEFRDQTYFIKGNVDFLVSTRENIPQSNQRKGIYGLRALAFPSFAAPVQRIAFFSILDSGGSTTSVRTIYYHRNQNSDTYIPTNFLHNFPATEFQAFNGTWNTLTANAEGPAEFCVELQAFPQAKVGEPDCVDAVVDRTPPTATIRDSGNNIVPAGGATNSTTVKVTGTETVPGSGIATIKLEGPSYSSTSYITGVQASPEITFPDSGSLSDGSYTATVTDLAGNAADVGFKIDMSAPTDNPKSSTGTSVSGGMNPNQCLTDKASAPNSGIMAVDVSDSSSTSIFSTQFPDCPTLVSVVTGICDADAGDYTMTVTNCAGTPVVSTITAESGSLSMVLYSTWPNAETHISGVGLAEGDAGAYDLKFQAQATIWNNAIQNDNEVACKKIAMQIAGQSSTSQTACFKGDDDRVTREIVVPSSGTRHDFRVWNDTDTVGNFGPKIFAILGPHVPFVQDNYNLQPGDVISGYVDLPQTKNSKSSAKFSASTITVVSPVTFVSISTASLSEEENQSATRSLLRPSSPHRVDVGADGGLLVIGSSTMTYHYEYLDTVSADTETLRLFAWDGNSWSSETIWGQTVSIESGTITVVGISSISLPFFAFYGAVDTSSPTTSISVVGSTFIFNGTVFLSTDSLVVLTSTDPVVDGFNSGVATTYYRIDPEPNDDWSVYTSSIPLSIGTHFVQYRSQDWAGNLESVKTATYTVTAGTVFKAPNAFNAEGSVLIGFLDSDAQFEVEARTQNDFVLRISSADGTAMGAISNIGSWGIGTELADATVEAAGNGEVTLQLRSGNSTGSWTRSQIALGYDGETAMRHLIKTSHYGSDAEGNAIRFFVWSPTVGSTAAVAETPVLSLDAISSSSAGMHILPVGVSSANLTVSDGMTLGAGMILAADQVSPSSIRYKEDIVDLGPEDYARAYADVVGLRHADFRYKGSDTVHRGLIYEDAPASIRGPNGTLSFDERLVNLEMSIQHAIERYEKILARLERRKQRGR